MTNISRGRSPHPDTTGEMGTIPDIRSPRAGIRRPDIGRDPKELLAGKIRGLIRSVKHGFYLDTMSSFTLKDEGWRISLEKEADGNQVLFGYFDNEPGQIPTTISATYSPTHLVDTHVTYNGPDGAFDSDDAFEPIVKTIKPHFTRVS